MITRHLHLKSKQRLVWLSVVVMLGVWGNALALFVCPHMLGGSCTREAPPPSDHCSAMKKHSSKPLLHRSPLSLALTTSSSECSQCIMQAADGLAPIVVAGAQNASYEKSFQSDALLTSFELQTITRSSVDLRDHGPPGSSLKLHVLINTYRI